MTDVTQILNQIESGDGSAADKLLPLVYEELRRLAAARMTSQSAGHTLQATGLVHEAYIRLVDVDQVRHWDSRGQFYAAAAEAMRRILVEAARKKALKRGGDVQRVSLNVDELADVGSSNDVLAISEALEKLTEHDAELAELVKLRYFAGLSTERAGELLNLSRTAAYEQWTFAKAWLRRELTQHESETS